MRVGSRYESPETAGISHVLEHMLFRGTERHPTSYEQNFAMEELGGTLGAATHPDLTSFDVTVPPEHVAPAVSLIVDMLTTPRFRNFETEKNVLREELLESLDDDGTLIDADELLELAIFGDHPLGSPIGGPLENLESLEQSTLERWHRTHYVGANVVVAIAGRFDEASIDEVRRSLSRLPRGPRSVALPFTTRQLATKLEHVDVAGSQSDVRVGITTFGEHDPRHLALSLFARVLDDGMSARVFKKMVDEEGLAYDAFGGLATYEDVGVLSLGATSAPERVPRTTAALLDVLRTSADDITERELEKVRGRFLFDLDCARDEPEAMAELVAEDRLLGRQRTLVDLERRVRDVRRDDLVEAAHAVVDAEGPKVVVTGPLEDRELTELRAVVRAVRTTGTRS